MKININLSILFLVGVIFVSCNSNPKKSNGSLDNSMVLSSQKVKKTQALILTQPFDYDRNDKNKISGDYISQNKITIPKNLSPQNKWIMFEGPILENDLVAYRYYADNRHRFDIYGKTVSNLMMDTVSWKYHDIMNWGSDILKVGNSLGLGSPAIWYQDSLHTLSNFETKTIEVIENSDERSMIRTTFMGFSIGEHTLDIVQDWSIEAGKPWSEIHLKVLNGSLPENMRFATGIVKHLPEIIQATSKDYFYAMNWGRQSFHKENMGMAILIDNKYNPQHVEDDLSHAYTFDSDASDVKYRFLSAWERDNNKVKDADEFKKLMEASSE